MSYKIKTNRRFSDKDGVPYHKCNIEKHTQASTKKSVVHENPNRDEVIHGGKRGKGLAGLSICMHKLVILQILDVGIRPQVII